MITKERLQVLIEQGAKIYLIQDNKIGMVRQRKYWVVGEDRLYWYCDKRFYIKFDTLFETKEEAEEYAEFGNITRTERLELPSWEQVQKEQDNILVELKTQGLDCLFVDKKNNYVAIEDRKWCNFRKPLTRENYNEARRLCVKLFKGEKINGTKTS